MDDDFVQKQRFTNTGCVSKTKHNLTEKKKISKKLIKGKFLHTYLIYR